MHHFLYYIAGSARLIMGVLLLWLSLYFPSFDSSYCDYLAGALLTSCYVGLVESRRLSFPTLIIFSFAPEILVNLCLYREDGLLIILVPEILVGLFFAFAAYMSKDILTEKYTEASR